jgi:transducin (beta)-like 1
MECSVPFSLLEPHHCELTGNTFNSEPVSSIKPPTASSTVTASTTKRPREEKKKQKDREKRVRREEEVDSRVKEEAVTNEQPNRLATKVATNGSLKDDQEMTEAPTEQPPPSKKGTEIKEEDVIVLQGHQSEVFSCAWNPVVTSLLASG